MAMQPVQFTPSGNIEAIWHDQDTQQLMVKFRSGKYYRYPGVTGDEADGFAQALSANQYLQEFIIPSHISERIEATEDLA